MDQVMVIPGALPAAAAGTASTAATVAAGSAAESAPMMAVLPGTASPIVVASTARVIEHGANRLVSSQLGAAVVAMVSATFADNGLGYDLVEAGNATRLL